MRSCQQLIARTSLGASLLLAAGCGQSPGPADTTGTTTQASVRTPQTALVGNNLPKFVDQLPTFNGRRVSGTATVNVNMQEFQQKVLPASVYAGLHAPFNAGTFLWGYNINNAGATLAGAHHRGPARHRHDGELHQQPHEHPPAESAVASTSRCTGPTRSARPRTTTA